MFISERFHVYLGTGSFTRSGSEIAHLIVATTYESRWLRYILSQYSSLTRSLFQSGRTKRWQACMLLGNTAHGALRSSHEWKPSTEFTTSPSFLWCCWDLLPQGCFSSGRTPLNLRLTGLLTSAVFTTHLWSTFLSPVPSLRGGTSAVACTPVLMCTGVATILKTESR